MEDNKKRMPAHKHLIIRAEVNRPITSEKEIKKWLRNLVKKIDTRKGDLIIFPSNFLYPHKITPVTKGVRYSYVSWVW